MKHEWMKERMKEGTNEGMNEWVNEWMNEHIDKEGKFVLFAPLIKHDFYIS